MKLVAYLILNAVFSALGAAGVLFESAIMNGVAAGACGFVAGMLMTCVCIDLMEAR